MKNASAFLDIRTPEGELSLNVSSILYVEDAGLYRLIHAAGTSLREARTLPELRRLLPDDFILSDLQHLVNLRHVIRPEPKGFRLTGDRYVPVAPFFEISTRAQFCRWLALRNWEIEPPK